MLTCLPFPYNPARGNPHNLKCSAFHLTPGPPALHMQGAPAGLASQLAGGFVNHPLSDLRWA